MRSWKATNGYGAAWTSLSPSDLHGTPVPMGTLPECSAELAVPGQGRRAEGRTDPGEPPEQAFLSPVLCLRLSSGALPPGLPSEQHGNGLLGISPPRCACPRDPFCKKQVCTQPVGEVSNPTAVTLRERKNR